MSMLPKVPPPNNMMLRLSEPVNVCVRNKTVFKPFGHEEWAYLIQPYDPCVALAHCHRRSRSSIGLLTYRKAVAGSLKLDSTSSLHRDLWRCANRPIHRGPKYCSHPASVLLYDQSEVVGGWTSWVCCKPKSTYRREYDSISIYWTVRWCQWSPSYSQRLVTHQTCSIY